VQLSKSSEIDIHIFKKLHTVKVDKNQDILQELKVELVENKIAKYKYK
jgi:hypothetical protein